MSEADPGEAEDLSVVVVRRFEPADAEAVAAMMKDLAAFHGEEASATASDVTLHASGPDRISDVWVAFLDGKQCAFAATYDWMNYVSGFPVRTIDLFFVRESIRGHGVGRALLRSLACDAKISGCKRMTVGAEADNEGANAFYRKMGFELRRPDSIRYVVFGGSLDRLSSA